MDKPSYVHILTKRRNVTLYTGVATNIVQRISQHRHGSFPGFTQEDALKSLVW
jgi:putative endonuclease